VESGGGSAFGGTSAGEWSEHGQGRIACKVWPLRIKFSPTMTGEFSRILTTMVSRLIAIVAALVITGAPVVTTACEGICAARASDPGTAAEYHSCHHEVSTLNETAITSDTHICGHSEEGPSAIGQSLWLLAAPAVVVDTFTFALVSLDASPFDGGSDHGPPLVSPPSTQLRI
jgi:hypothetical protein